METSLKTGFAQIFSCCPKILSCPKFWGGLQPPSPPRPVRIWYLCIFNVVLLAIFFVFFFQSERPTHYQETHSTLSENKKQNK